MKKVNDLLERCNTKLLKFWDSLLETNPKDQKTISYMKNIRNGWLFSICVIIFFGDIMLFEKIYNNISKWHYNAPFILVLYAFAFFNFSGILISARKNKLETFKRKMRILVTVTLVVIVVVFVSSVLITDGILQVDFPPIKTCAEHIVGYITLMFEEVV